jgi:hypothetical protein
MSFSLSHSATKFAFAVANLDRSSHHPTPIAITSVSRTSSRIVKRNKGDTSIVLRAKRISLDGNVANQIVAVEVPGSTYMLDHHKARATFAYDYFNCPIVCRHNRRHTPSGRIISSHPLGFREHQARANPDMSGFGQRPPSRWSFRPAEKRRLAHVRAGQTTPPSSQADNRGQPRPTRTTTWPIGRRRA